MMEKHDLERLETLLKGAQGTLSHVFGGGFQPNEDDWRKARAFVNNACEILESHLPIRKDEALRVLTSMSQNQTWTERNREIVRWALKKIERALRRDGRWQTLKEWVTLRSCSAEGQYKIGAQFMLNRMNELEEQKPATRYTTTDYLSGGATRKDLTEWKE